VLVEREFKAHEWKYIGQISENVSIEGSCILGCYTVVW